MFRLSGSCPLKEADVSNEVSRVSLDVELPKANRISANELEGQVAPVLISHKHVHTDVLPSKSLDRTPCQAWVIYQWVFSMCYRTYAITTAVYRLIPHTTGFMQDCKPSSTPPSSTVARSGSGPNDSMVTMTGRKLL